MKQACLTLVSGAIAVLGTFAVPAFAEIPSVLAQQTETLSQSSTPGEGQNILIHLQHGTDNLHAAFMALKLGTALQTRGSQVVLVLTLEGVRIADKNQPLDLRWGSNPITLGELYEQFVAAGGQIRVCPFCAEAVGMGVEDLRSGAQLAQESQDIPSLLLSADKVLDF